MTGQPLSGQNYSLNNWIVKTGLLLGQVGSQAKDLAVDRDDVWEGRYYGR
jgi:hypothetical protein